MYIYIYIYIYIKTYMYQETARKPRTSMSRVVVVLRMLKGFTTRNVG